MNHVTSSLVIPSKKNGTKQQADAIKAMLVKVGKNNSLKKYLFLLI